MYKLHILTHLNPPIFVDIADFAEAKAAWNRDFLDAGFGASAMEGGCGAIYNNDGHCIAVLSYDGRIWSPEAHPDGYFTPDHQGVEYTVDTDPASVARHMPSATWAKASPGGIVDEIDVFAAGDPSVGIQSSSTTLKGLGLDLDGYDESERRVVLHEKRGQVAALFDHWDDSIQVTFDFERE
ncbi:hypothetical protein A3709_19240 [Halioglobus sp. HI00S01]|uniref:hypothetical protein n=1 Tax=Halioglobus sp. HI00S01 TaxID=1822214 RepID=UPI0007C3E0F4|nr:hypothetical protein [Halioglobus sp. HI00S01]KZX57759.1 hypothetical protein A3709_19240 [Halioglobus sp. HI00S01]